MLIPAQARSRVHFPIPATVAAMLTLAIAPSSALADGELVNRADGPSGEPFNGELLGVSSDGGAVLLTGPGPLAGLPDNATTAFVRNRAAGTLEPVLRDNGAEGEIHSSNTVTSLTAWSALSISPDGKRVLIRALGNTDRYGTIVVRDLASDTTTTVSTLPDGSVAQASFGVFVDDGAAVLYTVIDQDGKPAIYRRNVAGGTAQLLKPGAWLTSATRDGSTFTWTRELAEAAPPAGIVPALPSAGGTAVGYTTVGGASRIVERPKLTIRANNAPYPYCNMVVREGTTPGDIAIDASGRHLWWSRRTTFATSPDTRLGYVERSTQATDSGATTERITGGGQGAYYDFPQLRQLGATGEFGLFYVNTRSGPFSSFGMTSAGGATPWTPPSRGATPAPLTTYTGRVFAQDRGYVTAEAPKTEDGSFRTEILAFDPTGPVPEPAPVLAPKANATDVADEAGLTPDVTFQGCVKPTAASIDVKLASPITTSKPIGTVKLSHAGAAPSKVTLTIKTLGFTTWTKTLTERQAFEATTLPRPWWFLPQTLTVTASFAAAGPIAASSISTSRSWMAVR